MPFVITQRRDGATSDLLIEVHMTAVGDKSDTTNLTAATRGPRSDTAHVPHRGSIPFTDVSPRV